MLKKCIAQTKQFYPDFRTGTFKGFGLHKSTVRQVCVQMEAILDHRDHPQEWSNNKCHHTQTKEPTVTPKAKGLSPSDTCGNTEQPCCAWCSCKENFTSLHKNTGTYHFVKVHMK